MSINYQSYQIQKKKFVNKTGTSIRLAHPAGLYIEQDIQKLSAFN
jgi:hypothetical protein